MSNNEICQIKSWSLDVKSNFKGKNYYGVE